MSMPCLDDQFPVAEVEQLPVAVVDEPLLPAEVVEQRPAVGCDRKVVSTVAIAVSTISGLETELKTAKSLRMAVHANG